MSGSIHSYGFLWLDDRLPHVVLMEPLMGGYASWRQLLLGRIEGLALNASPTKVNPK